MGSPPRHRDARHVVLVVAELAANAALHGRVPGRDFSLSLVRDPERGVLRIEVTDTHPVLPARRTPDPEEAGGRGLVLVGALAVGWGVDGRLGPGKTVWAECALPAHRPVKCDVVAPHPMIRGTAP